MQVLTAPGLPSHRVVVNFFVAGNQVVRWELTTMPGGGVFRLSLFHAAGTIVEYFTSADAALKREQQLEALFLDTPVTAGAAS